MVIKVTVGDGKYTFIQDEDGSARALRYGEEWRDCTGDGLMLALAQAIDEGEGTMLRFCDLPKGTRFRYPGDDSVWVVLEEYGNGLIAKWEGAHASRQLQCIYSFVDDEWPLESLVEVVS